MSREIARRSVLGALLAAWWTAKQGDGDRRLNVSDVCILAGVGLTWALEQYTAGKHGGTKGEQTVEHDASAEPDLDSSAEPDLDTKAKPDLDTV